MEVLCLLCSPKGTSWGGGQRQQTQLSLYGKEPSQTGKLLLYFRALWLLVSSFLRPI